MMISLENKSTLPRFDTFNCSFTWMEQIREFLSAWKNSETVANALVIYSPAWFTLGIEHGWWEQLLGMSRPSVALDFFSFVSFSPTRICLMLARWNASTMRGSRSIWVLIIDKISLDNYAPCSRHTVWWACYQDWSLRRYLRITIASKLVCPI